MTFKGGVGGRYREKFSLYPFSFVHMVLVDFRRSSGRHHSSVGGRARHTDDAEDFPFCWCCLHEYPLGHQAVWHCLTCQVEVYLKGTGERWHYLRLCRVTTQERCQYTTSVDIEMHCKKMIQSLIHSRVQHERGESAQEQGLMLYKSDQ